MIDAISCAAGEMLQNSDIPGLHAFFCQMCRHCTFCDHTQGVGGPTIVCHENMNFNSSNKKVHFFWCCIKCKKNVSDVSLPNTSLYFVHKCNTRSELHFFISTGFICTLADSANCSNGDVAAVED